MTERDLDKFVPRKISADDAARGYNNEGRGELIGYIAVPIDHEKTCRYRISTGGNPDKNPHELCTCRIGLWQEKTPTQLLVNEIRKMAKRTPKLRSIQSEKASLTNEQEAAIFAAYLGIGVLGTMCKKAGLAMGELRCKELSVELDKAFPGLTARSALRSRS